jgi:predicted dehydrogenase
MSASRERPLRGALIGNGFIGGLGHLPAYMARTARSRDIELVAVADSCPERLADAASRYPALRFYPDADTLFTAERSRIDFVDICTPPRDHAPLALRALSSGLHVLCEKPLTTTLAESDVLLDAARRHERVLFPCHNYLHAPVVRAIRQQLDAGRVGTLRTVQLNTMRNTHAKGVPEWHTHWRRFRDYGGGGIVMDHGSHSFYLLFDWFGTYPETVTAKLANLSSGVYDTEDNACISLNFPNGLATVQLSWTSGIRRVQYALHGDRGAILVSDDDLQIATMHATDGPDVAQGAVRWEEERYSIASHWGDASHTTWYDTLFGEFLTAIATGDHVSKSARDAHRCMATITAAYRSAMDGCREVCLAEVLDVREREPLAGLA